MKKKKSPKGNEVPNRIKGLRTARGMTQEKFAEVLGVGKSAVSAWEQGKYPPSPETYMRLANLASYPGVVWFWRQAGIDLDRMLSVFARLLTEYGTPVTADKLADVPKLAALEKTEVLMDTAVQILGVPPAKILKLIKSGEIKIRSVGAGDFYLIDYDSLIDYAHRTGKKK